VLVGLNQAGDVHVRFSLSFHRRKNTAKLIIIIIIIIYCNWVVTRWQWLFYMYTKYEIGY